MKTKPVPKKSLQLWMRSIHRVLGYLAVAMVIVYALSGITLIHRTGDFMRHDVEVSTTLKPDLSADGVAAALKIKNMGEVSESDGIITFASGTYNKASGETTYTKKELIAPFNKFAELHKMPCAKDPHVGVFTTLFGIVLFLLAVTSLFMYKPSAKQFKSNMIYTAIGCVIVIILVLLV